MYFHKLPGVFLIVAFSLVTGLLQAMLPDHIYKDRIAGSKIQAIAVVKATEELAPQEDSQSPDNARPALPRPSAPAYRSKTYTSKQAVFVIEKLIKLKSNSEEQPNGRPPVLLIEENISSANSENPVKKPLEISEGSEVTGIFHVPIVQTTDDPLFFNPTVGERVFVTISSDGGEITSYTVLDTGLENALLGDLEAVGIGIGRIFLR